MSRFHYICLMLCWFLIRMNLNKLSRSGYCHFQSTQSWFSSNQMPPSVTVLFPTPWNTNGIINPLHWLSIILRAVKADRLLISMIITNNRCKIYFHWKKWSFTSDGNAVKLDPILLHRSISHGAEGTSSPERPSLPTALGAPLTMSWPRTLFRTPPRAVIPWPSDTATLLVSSSPQPCPAMGPPELCWSTGQHPGPALACAQGAGTLSGTDSPHRAWPWLPIHGLMSQWHPMPETGVAPSYSAPLLGQWNVPSCQPCPAARGKSRQLRLSWDSAQECPCLHLYTLLVLMADYVLLPSHSCTPDNSILLK